MPPDIHHYNSKRLPACDACKLRRVKCDPVPPPEACSRCISKGIACTTTPVMRKRAKERSGKRIEAAKATFGAIRPLHEANPTPLIQAENFLVQFELSGELAAHLLELYSKLPRASLVPGAALSEKFEASGRRLSLLPRTSQVLALCILTLTSRLSSHPLLFGPGSAPPRLAAFLFDPGSIALDTVAEWGRRRENACERLREMAVESAWHARLLAGDGGDSNGFGGVSDEGMAACLLLEMIEDRHAPGAGRPWSAAFISLLRRKLEAKRIADWAAMANGQAQEHVDTNGYRIMVPTPASLPTPTPFPFPPPDGEKHAPRIPGLGWSVQIMREALSAAAQGQICNYTLQDEELLVGVKPTTPEQILEHPDTFGISESDSLRENYEGEDVRVEWWDFGAFYCLVRPFAYRMTEIALESFGWTSRRAHRAPFDVPKLEKHIESLIPIQNLLQLANKRLKMLLSPAGVEIRRRAGRGSAMDQAVGEEPGEYERQWRHQPDYQDSMAKGTAGLEGAHSPKDELRAQLTARTFHMLIRGCMGAVNVPIYIDLQERLLAIEQGHGCPGDDKERLETVLKGVRKALLPHALTLLKGVRSMVHLAWITHIGRTIRVSSSGATNPYAPSKDRDRNSVWGTLDTMNRKRTAPAAANPQSPPPTATSSSPTESSLESSPGSNVSPAPAPTVDPSPLSYAVFAFQQTPTDKQDVIPSVSPQCTPSYPSSFAWEAKVLTLIRMCISPRVFSRSGGNEPFSFWAQVILDSPTKEEGGTYFSRAEKIAELECSLDVFRVLSWSYPHLAELPLVHKIKGVVDLMKAQQTSGAGGSSPRPSGSSGSGSYPLSAPQNNALFRGVTPQTPLPTLKEALEGVPNERVSEVFFGGAVAGGLGLEGIEEVNDVIRGLAGELNKVFIDAAKSPNNFVYSNSPSVPSEGSGFAASTSNANASGGGTSVSGSSSDAGGPHTPELLSSSTSMSFNRAAEAFANMQSQDTMLQLTQEYNPNMTGIELSSFIGAHVGAHMGLEAADAFAETGHIPAPYGEGAWEAATSAFESTGAIHTDEFYSFRSAWDFVANQAQEEANVFGVQNNGHALMQEDQHMNGSSAAMFMDPMDFAPSMFFKPGTAEEADDTPGGGPANVNDTPLVITDTNVNGRFEVVGEPQMNGSELENQFQQLFGSGLYPTIMGGQGFQTFLQGLDSSLNDEVNRALRDHSKNGGTQH